LGDTDLHRFCRLVLPFLLLGAVTGPASAPASADEVGRIGTDWTGNDIVVEALPDPDVKGVTCHLTFFSRGLVDRLWQGNWFEDPSNTSIACRQTGPITIGKITLDDDGEEIFSQRQSLVFKAIAIRRIYDRKNDSLIYVSYSRQVKEGSAKMAVSTIPLWNAQATWTNGRPD
jgi:CreA protein